MRKLKVNIGSIEYLIYLPIENKQQNQSRQVSRWNVSFLLEAEEDHNHDQARDDVVTLSKQTTKKKFNRIHKVVHG